MVGIDHLAVIRLGPDDAGAGLALSAEANWNQNEADWRCFLHKGTVFGVRDDNGLLIATAALLPYGSGNAWISMVLVTANWRRRGLATRLVGACLDAAARQGITPWLDATPAGAAVYAVLGFAPTLQLRRLRLGKPAGPCAAVSHPVSNGDLAPFVARDSRAAGFDRGELLTELAGRPASRLLARGGAAALVRDGRTARQIGPLFSDGADQALGLIDDIVGSETAPLLIDVVSTHGAFLHGLTTTGWTVERPFQRMRLGGAAAAGADLPFAVAGPEYG